LAIVDRILPTLRRLERIVRPRAGWLAGPWARVPVGIICLVHLTEHPPTPSHPAASILDGKIPNGIAGMCRASQASRAAVRGHANAYSIARAFFGWVDMIGRAATTGLIVRP
jgi:hypothetical protein